MINEERNSEGNLEIHFSPLKPGVDHSKVPYSGSILTSVAGDYRTGRIPMVLPPTSRDDRRLPWPRLQIFQTIEKGPTKEFERLA